MSIVDGLGFRERESVGGIAGEQAEHRGHDLPSFRPPEGKPYVLLVWSRLMRVTMEARCDLARVRVYVS